VVSILESVREHGLHAGSGVCRRVSAGSPSRRPTAGATFSQRRATLWRKSFMIAKLH
jgi:hypothetical protein